MSDNVFTKIIDKHMVAFKESVTADIRGFLAGEGSTSAGTGKKRGRPAGKKNAVKAAKPAKTPKAPKEKKERKARTPKPEFEGALNDVISLVASNPGLQSADIIKKSGLAKPIVVKAINAALESGKLTKEGTTRNTKYFPAKADAPTAAAAE